MRPDRKTEGVIYDMDDTVYDTYKLPLTTSSVLPSSTVHHIGACTHTLQYL